MNFRYFSLEERTITVSGGTEAQVETQQLLPGILDAISLSHITPKLSFQAIRVLSSVSRAWLHAIRSRQVYHARFRTQATETFVMIRHYVSELVPVISLYSLRDNLSYELPPIPPLERGTPEDAECVFLDGKVYFLGGKFPNAISDDMKAIPDDMRAVFVLDLGGQWQWKQCASMQKGRRGCAGAAMDGHIYALGGWISGQIMCESEVYDPKEDKWSFIEPMPSWRAYHRAVSLGEEIFVHSGFAYDAPEGQLVDLDLEVYHPVKSDWRVVQPFQSRRSDITEIVFAAEGKFHAMNVDGISVYDMDRNVWTRLHSHSFDFAMDQEEQETFWPLAVVAVDDDEPLAVLQWAGRDMTREICLARCRGFGSENATIVWERAQCSLSFPLNRFKLYTIQL